MHARTALAYTMGLEPSELADYQYHPGRFPRAIYSFGDSNYFCLGKRPPKSNVMGHFTELQWKPYSDQFWAERAKTVIWKAESQPTP